MNTQVLGISVDPLPTLVAWADSFGGIQYPLLSDFWPHGAVSQRYGVLRSEGYSERALFVIDRYGVIRYIDIHPIDHQPENSVLFEVIRKIDPQAAANEPPQPEMVTTGPLPEGGIVLYCTVWCPACKRARQWLGERHIPFTEVDVHNNQAAARQLRQWTGGSLTTPTFNVDGDVLVNFDEFKLADLLKRHGVAA